MLSDMESKVYGRVRGVKHFVITRRGAIDNSVILSEAEGPPRRRR